MEKPIFGLVLVGGKSQRMGRDKALLKYHTEENQIERTTQLLKTTCERVFVSQRKEQAFPTPADTEVIYDQVLNIQGPLCGILSAMQQHRQAHWLVIACDLPHLKVQTLSKLISEFRQQPAQLTAYKSTFDGLPEPLCAIYPQGSDHTLKNLATEIGKSCPRKLLIIQKARLIEQDEPHSLDNINTAEEFAQITSR